MNANDVKVTNGRPEATFSDESLPTVPTETPVPTTRPTPFAAARWMMEDIDRLLEGWTFGKNWIDPVFGREGLSARIEEFGKVKFLPSVEIEQKDDSLIIRADIPGMKKDDIEVEMKDNALILKALR